MYAIRFAIAAGALGFVGCGGGSQPPATEPPASPPSSNATALAPGWHTQSIQHDGIERRFRLYLPSSANGSVPVVVLLHGGRGSMFGIVSASSDGSAEWPAIADDEGLLLVVPNGTNVDTGTGDGNDQSWNDCRPQLPDGALSDADDVGFIEALLEALPERLGPAGPVTPNLDRVYATGVSNGGMMSYRLAEERPARFAAIAAFIANRPEPSECAESGTSVAVFIANGTEDALMPYDGGTIAFNRGSVSSAEATRDYWLVINGVGPDADSVTSLPDTDPDDGSIVICEDYLAMTGDSRDVRFCRVEGGGHSVPSIVHAVPGRQNRDLEGARLAWEFLSGQ